MIKYKEELSKALEENDMREIENILRKCMDEKIKQGWKIAQNKTFSLRDKECCAIGSLLEHKCSFAQDLNEYNSIKLWDIAAGFDDYSNEDDNEEYWNLGRKLAKEFLSYHDGQSK